MDNKKSAYDDGEIKIELFGIFAEFATTDELISKLDINQRIRILEFINGIRDIEEVRDDEVAVVGRVLAEGALLNRISPELDPTKWNLPYKYEEDDSFTL